MIFEEMLGYADHVGLYAEEIRHRGEALDNFLQAFTHLGLISAAFNLDRVLRGLSSNGAESWVNLFSLLDNSPGGDSASRIR